MNMNFIAFSSAGSRPAVPWSRPRGRRRWTALFEKIYQADVFRTPPAAGESLRTPPGRSEGVERRCGEACALERSDAPIRIGAQLGRESVHGLERALHRGAVGGGLRSQRRTHASATSK